MTHEVFRNQCYEKMIRDVNSDSEESFFDALKEQV